MSESISPLLKTIRSLNSESKPHVCQGDAAEFARRHATDLRIAVPQLERAYEQDRMISEVLEIPSSQPLSRRAGRKAVAFTTGNRCLKCSQPMMRKRHPDGWRPKPKQAYYFTEWDVCVDCRHLQHYEEFRCSVEPELITTA